MILWAKRELPETSREGHRGIRVADPVITDMGRKPCRTGLSKASFYALDGAL
jgi:hypothetical protein